MQLIVIARQILNQIPLHVDVVLVIFVYTMRVDAYDGGRYLDTLFIVIVDNSEVVNGTYLGVAEGLRNWKCGL